MAERTGRWTGSGAHRTRTFEWQTGERFRTKSNGSSGRWVATMVAKAECQCGWSYRATDRAFAQHVARQHRAEITVSGDDLTAMVQNMCEQAIPFDLHRALGRLADAASTATNTEVVMVELADLPALLRWANRPWTYVDHPWIARLIDVVEAASRDRVGMLDSVHSYCEMVADAHGLGLSEWLALMVAQPQSPPTRDCGHRIPVERRQARFAD